VLDIYAITKKRSEGVEEERVVDYICILLCRIYYAPIPQNPAAAFLEFYLTIVNTAVALCR